jgi:DNA-binding LacI/PurR family transcriptional regulator
MRLQEVARRAGVSLATVSRVANGLDGVSPKLRERVMRTASKLGMDLWQKNRSKVVAFLLSNRGILHPFHSSVLMAAEAYCATHEYGVLFLPLEYGANVPWKNLPIPPVLQRHELIRGAIVAGTNSQNLLDYLDYKGVSFVVLGNNVTGDWQKEKYSAVYFDDIEGGYEATRYLQSLGHSSIWFVGNCRLPWFARRGEGYRRAMTEASFEVLVSEVDSDAAEDIGYVSTKTILTGGRAVTAIFAGEDAAARGAYRAISDRGLRVPEDISVVGFNDTSEATALNPPLTTIRVFTDQLGRQMAECVLERLAQPDLDPKVVTLPTQVVKRESCAPFRR